MQLAHILNWTAWRQLVVPTMPTRRKQGTRPRCLNYFTTNCLIALTAKLKQNKTKTDLLKNRSINWQKEMDKLVTVPPQTSREGAEFTHFISMELRLTQSGVTSGRQSRPCRKKWAKYLLLARGRSWRVCTWLTVGMETISTYRGMMEDEMGEYLTDKNIHPHLTVHRVFDAS